MADTRPDRLRARKRGAGAALAFGASTEISILDLAQLIIDVTNSRSEISPIPYDEAYGEGFEDMYRRVPDTTKVQELIDWRPTRTLQDVGQNGVAYQRGSRSLSYQTSDAST